ncbi:hypothetical protein DH2020_043712 [Rehmannia glutinosa]|uniref:Uncharacterized protein n=1 Tax=Rehmannia glutinosa TaxID=99300 RepID=A0ABR0UJS6_REHGL
MCRGFQQNERELLKIEAFYTQLSDSCSENNTTNLPDFLTLHYLPRINGSLLEINGSNIRPDSPAFLTLHRVLSKESRGFIYGSRERVVVCEGARFEIYVGDVKVLKGIFRKDEGENWKMDCKCALSANDVVEGVKDAEVSVAADGPMVMTEKVEMVAAIRRRRGRCCELEEIPEEREVEREGFLDRVCACAVNVVGKRILTGRLRDGDGGVRVVDVIFMEAFQRMKIDLAQIVPVTVPLVGFTGEVNKSMEEIRCVEENVFESLL